MMHFAFYFLFNPATFPLVITLIILINRQSVFSTLRLPHPWCKCLHTGTLLITRDSSAMPYQKPYATRVRVAATNKK